MRKIKFRAYSKSFNTMFNYDMLQVATYEMVDMCNEKLKATVPESTNIQMGLFLPTEDEDLILMQYTGLKDKNGKEIYEGDIIKYSHSIVGTIIREVRIKYGMWGIEGMTKGTQIPFANLLENEYEVIGNKFENPELLG